MNEERLEREKNKRIKLNGTSTSTEIASNSQSTSQSHSTSQTHPTSSNGTLNKKVTNGTDRQESQNNNNQKEITKLHPKMSKLLSTSGKRIQKELAELTIDPPPNCR